MSREPDGVSLIPHARCPAAAECGQGCAGGRGGVLRVDEAQPTAAACGVRAMWVSRDARRRGVATCLLDSARCCAFAYLPACLAQTIYITQASQRQ